MRFGNGLRLACGLGVLCALALPARGGEQEVLRDDFNRPDGPVGGWTVYQGAWSISAGRMTTTTTATSPSWIWFGAPPFRVQGDLELHATVTFGAPPAGDVGRHGGFMIFASEPTNRYAAPQTGYTIDWIDRAGDHGFRLLRVDSGASHTILVNGTPDVSEPPEDWKIQVDGDYIRILADDAVVAEVMDATYREGYVAAWAYENLTQIFYDDLELTCFPVPSACFSFEPQVGAAPLAVAFDASCSGGPHEIVDYAWDFGDGEAGSGKTTSHEYVVGGSYMITLTVTDALGNTVAATATILVYDSAPSFSDDFERPDGPVDGWTVYSGAWNISNGLLTTTTAGAENWAWAGDPPYSFPANFTLEFTLNFALRPADVVGRHGGVMFCATKPTWRYDATINGYTVDWIDRTADHGVRLIRVTDGAQTVLDIGARDPSLYPDPPTYWRVVVEGQVIRVFGDDELLLEARDGTYRRGLFGVWGWSNGQVLEFDDMVVTSPALSPCFTATKELAAIGEELTFDAGCSSATGTPIETYSWDFGDGTTGEGRTVAHAYAAAGFKTVKLTITTEGGLSADTERTIGVYRTLEEFEDDFERPDGPPSGWTVVSGEWTLAGGGLEVTVPGGAAEAWIYADAPPARFEGSTAIEFDIEFLSERPLDTAAVGRHAGVFLCAERPAARGALQNDGYGIDWIDRETDGTYNDYGYRIYRFDDGVQTINLLTGTPGEPGPGKRWRIELDGDVIRLIVDGALKAEVTDGTYRAGHLGFWAFPGDAATGWVQQVRYDNLAIGKGGPAKPTFRRGDANADGGLNITDGIFVLNYLFLGGPEPPCVEAADPNDDGSLNITDGIFVLNYLFLGGPAPSAPGPDVCGPDPAGSPDVGCASYTKC